MCRACQLPDPRLTNINNVNNQSSITGIPSLVSVNGDFLGGSRLAEKTNGRAVIEVLNHMNVDLVTVGNHEFDYGAEELMDRISESSFLWLGANITDTRTSVLMKGVQAHKVIEVGGVKVGVFGLCTRSTPTQSYPGDFIKFGDPIAAAKASVADLHAQGADVIVAVTHLSLKEDQRLLEQVPAIDVLLGGHDHDPVSMMQHDSLLFKCGQNAYWVGVVDVFLQPSNDSAATHPPPPPPPSTSSSPASSVPPEADRAKPFLSWSMISTRGVEPDTYCTDIVKAHHMRVEKQEQAKLASQGVDLDSVLGVLGCDFSTKTASLRTRPSAAGDFFANCMHRYYSDLHGVPVDLATLNGGFIRGDKTYEENTPLTIRTVKDELPFPRITARIAIRGEHLRKGVEQQLRFLPAPSGSFPNFSESVKMEFDPKRPPLARIVSFSVNDEPLQDDKVYVMVMTEFLAGGGDGCDAYLNHDRLEEVQGRLVSDLVIAVLGKDAKENGTDVKTLMPLLSGRVAALE
jgi:2',3'-cyclic-nucleotide 2'-phosphodiesterase (5'-nucleotidase family)